MRTTCAILEYPQEANPVRILLLSSLALGTLSEIFCGWTWVGNQGGYIQDSTTTAQTITYPLSGKSFSCAVAFGTQTNGFTVSRFHNKTSFEIQQSSGSTSARWLGIAI